MDRDKNSAKMASFLTLVKEEPIEGPVAMEVSGRSMPIAVGHSAAPLPDPQMQPLTLVQINSSNFQSNQGTSRVDIDPNFEPISRGRSNTWPLPCPEGFMEGEEPGLLEPSASGDHNRLQGNVQNFMEAAGGAPKKNTSRRNPWGNMSYADLIAQAIVSSPEGRATLSQIYDWMVQNINYFKDKGDSNSSAGWKNSIRHNLSLHSRFMRMQNEGTGKSSWWVLNPDAKPGKSTRRRANTLEGGAGRLEKNKRGRMRKKVESLRNGLDAPVSPTEGSLDFYPSSPSGAGLHGGFQLSPQDYRPRASSNASSCGRLSPIPAVEADMHDSQVPPVSPGVSAWGPDYWSASNHHITGPHAVPHLMGRIPHHEHYTDQLVDSIEEGLNLRTRENWPPHNGMSHMNGTNPDCMKMGQHMHPLPMNGFMNHAHHPHPAFGSYEDFSRYIPSNPLNRGYQPPLHEKTNQQRHHHFQLPTLQNVSPAHSLSPPNGVNEGLPSYSSPPHSQHHSPPQNHIHVTPSHHNPSTSHHTTPPGPPHPVLSPASQNSPLSATLSPTSQPFNVPISSSNQHQSPPGPNQDPQPSTSTTMLRVAFSHRDASSCSHNATHKLNGMGQPHPMHPNGGAVDLADLEGFQGGLECNVEEVIKHELQYDETLTFDFHQHGQNAAFAYGHAYANQHANSPSQLTGSAGPPSVVQCTSIQAGNHWVR